MNKFHIFVEGEADREFIIQFSKFLKENKELDITLEKNNVSTLNGYSLNEANAKNIKDKSHLKVILMVDADKSFEDRVKYYAEKKVQHDISFDLFLIPNNKEKGNAESIYEAITTRKDFWNCFDGYLKCIKDKGFQTTLSKSKIYAYSEAMRESVNNEHINKQLDFLDKKIWDLGSEYLFPLKAKLQELTEFKIKD